jgi:isopenicillin-N epimerase
VPPAERFRAEFDWTGTGDPTAWLSVPEAIRVVAGLVRGGWPDVRRRNHERVIDARDRLCAALAIESPAPDGMLGSMASLPLADGPSEPGQPDSLQDRLWNEYRIEVPVIAWPAAPSRVIRVSAQLYNAPAQYEMLADALSEILRPD